MGSQRQQQPSNSWRKNAIGLMLIVFAAMPSLLMESLFLLSMRSNPAGRVNDYIWPPLSRFYAWGRQRPVSMLAVMFLVNVDILFWVISLLQRSTWLIDPYWTFLPVMMAAYYALHPEAKAEPSRSMVTLGLVVLWSLRLTHSYLRRESWKLGSREDWRFSDLRAQYGRHWWWASFFLVYVSQQVFLMGICLPIYAAHSSIARWQPLDAIATGGCLLGLVIGYVADTQLYNFVTQSSATRQPKRLVLDQGLWRLSRHPNYFGEQVFWWSFAMFGVSSGKAWTVTGTVVNSACLAYVTILVELRMLSNKEREEAYREYQQTTSVLLPWPKLKAKIKAI